MPGELKYKPIAKHFTEKILPKGVVILNNQPTHFSSTSLPAVIDHVTSTNPAVITNMTTIKHGASDHCILSFIRHTKAPVSAPRYKMIRNYREIEPFHLTSLLWASPSLREASFHPDPDVIAELIISGITCALDEEIKRIGQQARM